MTAISDLWTSEDPSAWNSALERYWSFVQPRNLELERSLDALDLERVRSLDARGWFDFLQDEYFRWKYTTRNRYATTTRELRHWGSVNQLAWLDRIREQLLALDADDIRLGLRIATSIPGLGTAGASGLLALMYPQKFGTVDQFAVKALRQVEGLPEAEKLCADGLHQPHNFQRCRHHRRSPAKSRGTERRIRIHVLDAQEAGHGFVGGAPMTTSSRLPARGYAPVLGRFVGDAPERRGVARNGGRSEQMRA